MNTDKAFYEIKPASKQQPGICPCCGGVSLDYGVLELEGDQCAYPYTCRSCQFTGKEWYQMIFIEHAEG